MEHQQQITAHSSRWKAAGAWTAAGLTALALFLYSILLPLSAKNVDQAVAGILIGFLKTLFSDTMSPAIGDWLNGASEIMLLFCGYALLAFLIWLAFTCMKCSDRKALIGSFALSVLFTAIAVFCQQFVPGRILSTGEIMADCLGIVLTLLCIILLRWLWVKCPRVFNWEVISYIIFGVLTTIVNIVANGICKNNLHINYLISNFIAWLAAVLFAYVVNKVFVFHSHNETKRQALREFSLFIGARVVSFGVDEPGMILLYGVFHMNNGVAKIITNILVMIINYFFSKLIIFRKAKSVKE